MQRRIAILFHETDRGQRLNYLIYRYADIWQTDGHEVVLLYGVANFVPADLMIVHVDLSVVPEEYLEFSRRYPIVLNGALKDIRKSTYSQLLIQPGDSYDGPVIVKSDLNYAGLPEYLVDSTGSPPLFRSPLDYQVFAHRDAIPPDLLKHPDAIVEKFVPEFADGLYFTRTLLFFGNRFRCTRIAARHPIVNTTTRIHSETVAPDPAIVELISAMKFDFGKFDYVVHAGRALLLDVNKTVGAGNHPPTPERLAERRYRAEGLYAYLDRASQSTTS